MNKQEKLTGYLLILAAITFWISWELAIHISSSLFLMIKIITNFQKTFANLVFTDRPQTAWKR